MRTKKRAKRTAFRGLGWLTWKALAIFGVGYAKRKVQKSPPPPALKKSRRKIARKSGRRRR